MAFHIVTDRCFLACEKVTSVVVEEVVDPVVLEKSSSKKKTVEKKAKASKKPKATSQFYITISYYPLALSQQNFGNGFSSSNSRSDQENILEIRVKTEKEANALFKEIIAEVQEQHPNEAYLDKLVDKLLTGTKFSEVELEDNAD